MSEISLRGEALPPSPIRKLYPLANKAEQRGKKVYHLNIGQPDIKTPREFMEGVRKANIEVLSYSPSRGIDSVLDSLQSYYNHHSLEITKEQISITTGGSEACLFALLTTSDRNDEIIIPEPFYTNYKGFAQIAGINVVPLTTKPQNNFKLPSRKEIEKLITPHTSAILITNPGNPTGSVYTVGELKLLRDIANEHDIFLIADEVYREFVYEDRKTTGILGLNGLEENGIMVDSISKRFSACGARIGVIASRNEKVMETVTKLSQARLSPPTLGQLGLKNLLDSPSLPSIIENTVQEFERRREVVLRKLKTVPQITFGKPQGAFYLIIKLPVKNAEHFSRWLLTDFEQQGETVMVAPGEGFYETPGKGVDEIRLSYVLSCEKLSRSIDLLSEALQEYPDK